MILEISNEIEEALKNEGLVGRRIGSGFCLLDNSRDVQFEYSSNEVKDYFSKIEKVINELTEKYKDYEIVIRFRNDSFSFCNSKWWYGTGSLFCWKPGGHF